MSPTVRIVVFSIAVALLAPFHARAQGIRMSPEFLPLDLGNVWRYQITDAQGNEVGGLEYRIIEYSIVDGSSFYVFDRFPFSPDLEINRSVAIRYDQANRQFIWFDGERQADLFPSLGASAEVIETGDDGFPRKALFQFEGLVLTLERGLGVTQAGFVAEDGPRVASLIAARVSGTVLGATASQPDGAGRPSTVSEPLAVAEPVENRTTPDEVRPELSVTVSEDRDFHRLVLTVTNLSDQLMPFDFATSQTYDFVVTNPSNGQEVWRWSQRRFFSEVTRSEAIRGGGAWTFEGEWNYRNNSLEEVPPGTYEVYGILTASESIESDGVEFVVE